MEVKKDKFYTKSIKKELILENKVLTLNEAEKLMDFYENNIKLNKHHNLENILKDKFTSNLTKMIEIEKLKTMSCPEIQNQYIKF